MKTTIALLAFILSTPASAQTLPIHILYGTNRYTVPRAVALAVFTQAADAIHQELGITIVRSKVTAVRVNRLPLYKDVALTDFPYGNVLRKYSRHGELVFLLAPAMKDPTNPRIRWSGGAAQICGAYGFASLLSDFSDVILIEHELGHLMGATHEPGNVVMNPGAAGMAEMGQEIGGFTERNKAEVGACRG